MDYEALRKPRKLDTQEVKLQREREILQCIPARYRHASFDNFAINMKKQQRILAFVKKYAVTFPDRLKAATSLIFSGYPGTGKTHLSWCLYRDLTQSGFSIDHTCLTKLLHQYELTKQDKINFRLEKWNKSDLLIIDEVATAAQEAAWKKAEKSSVVFEIINARYEAKNKPVLLITNFTLSQLRTFLGEKTIDRLLHHGYLLKFDWESQRSQKQLREQTH